MSALACLVRGHDLEVRGVLLPAALLVCSRCGRQRLAAVQCELPERPPPAAAVNAVLVDREALQLLQASAEVNGALAGELLARLRREGGDL